MANLNFLTAYTVMVVIRLSRGGSKGSPFFNIVVADSLNVATIATITRISNNDVEEWGTLGTTARKTNNDHDGIRSQKI